VHLTRLTVVSKNMSMAAHRRVAMFWHFSDSDEGSCLHGPSPTP
jgi:hypothetical protein